MFSLTHTRYRYVYLLGIITLAFFVRTLFLSTLPAGFFCDEAATGYNAYTLLMKGTDEYGKLYPVFFDSFGNWRPGLPFYLTIPSIKLFGLNEFSTRLPSAVVGTMTVVFLYILVKQLTHRTVFGLCSAFLLAISPWHIHFSRVGQENIYLPWLVVMSFVVGLYALKNHSTFLFGITGMLFGLSLFTYYPSYAITPWILGTFILYALSFKRTKRLFLHLLLMTVIFFSLFSLVYFSSNTTHIFNRQEQLKRYWENKTPSDISKGIIKTYIDHFMPEFLFTKGDYGYYSHFLKRYSVRGMGQLYLFQAPLLLIGFTILFIRNKRAWFVTTMCLLVYPIGSSIAPFADGGGPFATRSIFGIIPFTILTGVGLGEVIQFVVRIQYIGAIVALGILTIIEGSFCWYWYEYSTSYNSYASNYWGWQYGAGEIMRYYTAIQDEYDELFLPDSFNGPDIFLKFYDPTNLCNGKCKIGRPDNKRIPYRKQLFSIYYEEDRIPSTLMERFSIQKTIPYPDGKPAFYIGTLPFNL